MTASLLNFTLTTMQMFWNSKSILIKNFLIYHKLRYWYWFTLLLAVSSSFFMIQHCFFNKHMFSISIGYLQISERNKHYLVVLWIWVCVAGIAFPLNACILILKNSNWWLIHLSNITQGCLIKLYATILVWMFLGALFQMGLRTWDGHRKILWSPAVIQTSGLNSWNYLYVHSFNGFHEKF